MSLRGGGTPRAAAPTGRTLERTLGLRDLGLIVVGAVIGSGIFIVPATVLRHAGGDAPLAIGIWAFGGILSLLGALTYGELAADLGQRFESRWVKKGAEVSEDALEVPDFSAVTDAYSIVANVSSIRLVPIEPRETMILVLAALLPFVPLLLVTIPVADLLRFAADLVL